MSEIRFKSPRTTLGFSKSSTFEEELAKIRHGGRKKFLKLKVEESTSSFYSSNSFILLLNKSSHYLSTQEIRQAIGQGIENLIAVGSVVIAKEVSEAVKETHFGLPDQELRRWVIKGMYKLIAEAKPQSKEEHGFLAMSPDSLEEGALFYAACAANAFGLTDEERTKFGPVTIEKLNSMSGPNDVEDRKRYIIEAFRY